LGAPPLPNCETKVSAGLFDEPDQRLDRALAEAVVRQLKDLA
jgi:hypothetical protein